MVTRKESESTEQMIVRFNHQVQRDGILSDFRSHDYYMPKSEKRKLKSYFAMLRRKKQQKGWIR